MIRGVLRASITAGSVRHCVAFNQWKLCSSETTPVDPPPVKPKKLDRRSAEWWRIKHREEVARKKAEEEALLNQQQQQGSGETTEASTTPSTDTTTTSTTSTTPEAQTNTATSPETQTSDQPAPAQPTEPLKTRRPSGFWQDKNNQRSVLEQVKIKYNITTPEQWRDINRKQFQAAGASSVLLRYRSTEHMLEELYPGPDWKTIFAKTKAVGSEGGRRQSSQGPGKDLMLLQIWNPSMDPTGYWISEKYDGMRAFFDSDKGIFSRYGRKYPAPQWWLDKLPKNVSLDGEIWAGHGGFPILIGSVRSNEDRWANVQYIAFDIVDKDQPFEKRLEILQQLPHNEHFSVIKYEQCRGTDHLNAELDRVEKLGGEGLVIRKPEGMYTAGRSHDILKVKRQQDAEVKFIKLSRSCMGYDCETPTGQMVSVRCTSSDHRFPPAPGTIVTVRHFGAWQSGKLKNAFLWRPRNDITWEEVVAQHKRDFPEQHDPGLKSFDEAELEFDEAEIGKETAKK